jgi:hypothetical protein
MTNEAVDPDFSERFVDVWRDVPVRHRCEGTVYRRADGRWAAIVDLGCHDGSDVERTVYGKTRPEVAQRPERRVEPTCSHRGRGW